MLPIDDGAPEATRAFVVHIIHRKSDGTNSSIWRRSKLFVMEVTGWCFCHPIVLEVAPLPRCSRSARSTTGLFPLSCPWTEVDTHQLQNTQMRSIGVLTEREAATEVLQEPLTTRSLRMYLDTDDGASAQIKTWQLQCGECEDNLLVWSSPVSSGPQRCVRTCGPAPSSSLPVGRRFLRHIVQVDELVAMLLRQDLQVMGLRERSRHT